MKIFFNSLQKIYDFLKLMRFDSSLRELKQCDVLFLCHDSNRGLNLQGKHYSPLIDTFREEIQGKGWNCQTISHPWSVLTGEESYGSPISVNRQFSFEFVKTKIMSFIMKKDIRPYEIYERILSISKPICVVVINSPIGLSKACKKLEIPQFEILHGVGYSSVPWGWDKLKNAELPGNILSFDNISTETFSKLKGINVKQTQNPFIKRFTQERANLPSEWVNKLQINNKFRKEILISLQWGYSGEIEEYAGFLPNGLFPDALIEVIRDTKEEILWRFRFHPTQLKNKRYSHQVQTIKELCANEVNTEWEFSSFLPVPEILRNCTGHLTMSSMTAYEAAYLGVPTLMLSPLFREGAKYSQYFADLRSLGYLTNGSMDKESLISWATGSKRTQALIAETKNNISWDETILWILGNQQKNAKT